MIKLFVGLGNPGPEYEATRHNAGFWWIDALARDLKVSLVPERSYHGFAARAQVNGQPVWLLQPQTFMNLSGKSVAALARFFKIEPAQILVVHDELDLMPGHMKLKLGGSPAGHKGLKDIHAQLGTPDYWRLRLGIGHPGVKAEVTHHYKVPIGVLGIFGTDRCRLEQAAVFIFQRCVVFGAAERNIDVRSRCVSGGGR